MPHKRSTSEKHFIKDLKTLNSVDCARKYKISIKEVNRERQRRNIKAPDKKRHLAPEHKAIRDDIAVSSDLEKLIDKFLLNIAD